MNYSTNISAEISSKKSKNSIISQLISLFLEEKPKGIWKFKLILLFSNMQIISLLMDNTYPNFISEQYRTGYLITILNHFSAYSSPNNEDSAYWLC